jgi:AcrR family transcriptional regulator
MIRYDTNRILKPRDHRSVVAGSRNGHESVRSVSYDVSTMTMIATVEPSTQRRRRGRPRSDATHQKILDATRELLTEGSFARLRIEHVAARAGVSKAAIYRRWKTKEDLAGELLAQLAGPHIAVAETGDTREELLAAVLNPMRAVTDMPFGPVIRSVLSQIATDPTLGDPFRATVVQARRNEITRVIERGIALGDLRPDADPGVATELLVGPVYFRVMFGGDLDASFAARIVDSFLRGYGSKRLRKAARRKGGDNTATRW